MTPNDLCERLLEFSARVGKVVDAIPHTRLGQLVRCGTSAAPNYEEGCAAESKKDFVHKLNIALKELRESRSWLRLTVKANLLPTERLHELIEECTQLCNIMAKSIVTAKGNDNKTKTRAKSV